MQPELPRSWAAAVAIAVLVAYVAMTPPVPGDGDSGEFTLVLARGALAHPTGYPIYTMLGHGFAVVLHGAGLAWAYAAALWSALGGGVAAYFFFRLADRLSSERFRISRPARFAMVTAATLVFSLNPMVSFEATHAEVYSWHLAWITGAALLFVHAMTDVFAEDPGRNGVIRISAWWGFVCGVGLAHHTTSVLLAGPATLALLWRLGSQWPRRLPWVIAGIPGALLAIASYGFVFWRISHPDAADWVLFDRSFEGAIAHVQAAQYQDWVFGEFKPSEIQRQWLGWWIYPFLFPGLGLLAASAIVAAPRTGRRLACWTLGVAAVAQVLFTFRLRVDDPCSYFLAPLALGLAAIPAVAVAIGSRSSRLAMALASLMVAGTLVAAACWIKTGLDRRTATIAGDSLLRDMWRAVPAGRGFLFWDNDMFHRLRAFQLLDGENRELEVWETCGLEFPRVRTSFVARFGFDPFEGIGDIIQGPVSQTQAWEAVHDNVNRKSPLPVYEFHPESRRVRMLKKPPRVAESK